MGEGWFPPPFLVPWGEETIANNAVPSWAWPLHNLTGAGRNSFEAFPSPKTEGKTAAADRGGNVLLSMEKNREGFLHALGTLIKSPETSGMVHPHWWLGEGCWEERVQLPLQCRWLFLHPLLPNPGSTTKCIPLLKLNLSNKDLTADSRWERQALPVPPAHKVQKRDGSLEAAGLGESTWTVSIWAELCSCHETPLLFHVSLPIGKRNIVRSTEQMLMETSRTFMQMVLAITLRSKQVFLAFKILVCFLCQTEPFTSHPQKEECENNS